MFISWCFLGGTERWAYTFRVASGKNPPIWYFSKLLVKNRGLVARGSDEVWTEVWT